MAAEQPLSLLALIVAAISAFAVSYMQTVARNYATKEDLRNELDRLRASETIKREVAIRMEVAEEQRRELQKLIGAASTLLHSMCWVTWSVKARGRVDPQACATYDAQAYRLVPEIATHLALIASYDVMLHDELAELLERVMGLDGAIGDALVECGNDEKADIRRLIELHHEGLELEEQLRRSLRGILGRHFSTVKTQEDGRPA